MHDEEANKIEQSIAGFFPDEFPLYPPECGGARNYRSIGDHVPLSMVMMLCSRFGQARAEITRLKAEVERCQSLRWFAICRQIATLVGCKSLENLYQAVEAKIESLKAEMSVHDTPDGGVTGMLTITPEAAKGLMEGDQ